jgi:molybdopterin converting factor small subunit
VTVSVLLFARYREAAGAPAIEVEVPAGATLGGVWEAVQARVPALRAETRPLLACERRYALAGTPVPEGAEVAAFPPVSGG